MSTEDSFGFTHLEEDDGDTVPDIGLSRLDVDLQPHLPPHDRFASMEASGHYANERSKWEKFDSDGIDNPAMQIDEEAVEGDLGATNSVFSKKSSVTDLPAEHQATVHNHQEKSNINGTSETSMNGSQSAAGDTTDHATSLSDIRVQYSSTDGKVSVMPGQVVTRPDGSHYIDTQGIPQRWSELERPLRQRKIRFLKIFSTAACFLFFPLGIPAMYYAFKTEKKFNEGIMQGNIDTAQKYAKRSERFTIMSFIMAIVTAALIVAIIERPYYAGTAHRGTVVG